MDAGNADMTFTKVINQDVSTLTSTSAAPGSLLKHMVMVFRAILKKLVKDTDFPCNKEAFKHGESLPDEGIWRKTLQMSLCIVFGPAGSLLSYHMLGKKSEGKHY